jgi:hypothetical protein
MPSPVRGLVEEGFASQDYGWDVDFVLFDDLAPYSQLVKTNDRVCVK